MTLYRYHGPVSGLTLLDGTEVRLIPGALVSLPDSPTVKTLLKTRHLIAVPATADEPAKRTTRKGA